MVHMNKAYLRLLCATAFAAAAIPALAAPAAATPADPMRIAPA